MADLKIIRPEPKVIYLLSSLLSNNYSFYKKKKKCFLFNIIKSYGHYNKLVCIFFLYYMAVYLRVLFTGFDIVSDVESRSSGTMAQGGIFFFYYYIASFVFIILKYYIRYMQGVGNGV